MEPKQDRELDALYIAWSDNREAEAPAPLRDWATRYPDYTADIARWEADAAVLDCAAEREPDVAGEARALAIGRRVVAEARARYMAAASTEMPLRNLLDAAKSHGMNAKTLAVRLGIGVPLVAKLNQRLLVAATVPDTLVFRLAEALDATAAQVRAYLSQPATLASSAMYKSSGVPQAAEPEDFTAAVRDCADMTPEQKAFWIGETA